MTTWDLVYIRHYGAPLELDPLERSVVWLASGALHHIVLMRRAT